MTGMLRLKLYLRVTSLIGSLLMSFGVFISAYMTTVTSLVELFLCPKDPIKVPLSDVNLWRHVWHRDGHRLYVPDQMRHEVDARP